MSRPRDGRFAIPRAVGRGAAVDSGPGCFSEEGGFGEEALAARADALRCALATGARFGSGAGETMLEIAVGVAAADAGAAGTAVVARAAALLPLSASLRSACSRSAEGERARLPSAARARAPESSSEESRQRAP